MRYLRLTLLSLATCATAAMFSGCGSSVTNNAMAAHAPKVAGVGAEANGVAPNRWVYVQFNQAMNPATINNQTVVVSDSSGRSVPGNVAYYQNYEVAGFQPNPALQVNTNYTLSITTGVKSAQNVSLAAPYTYNFATRADTDKSPIFVKTVTPANGATCVSDSTLITLTFSEGADVSTLTSSNIVLTGPGSTGIPADLSYNVASAQVTISPNAALPSGAITVTVKDVADAAGVVMTTPYTWRFSTACSTGGGGGGPATTQYMAPIFSDTSAWTSTYGQVTVDTQGMVNLQLTNAGSGSSYAVQFCEAVNPSSQNPPTSCIAITKVTTNSSGSASATLKFPQAGNWAGDFVFLDKAGKQAYQTFIAPNYYQATYMTVLLPDDNTNNGAIASGQQQDPLSSGTVTVSGSTITYTVKGASPSTFYMGIESETTYIGGSGTYALCSFTTDAQGNGSCNSPVTGGNGGDMLQVEPQYSGAGYIGGFAVPN